MIPTVQGVLPSPFPFICFREPSFSRLQLSDGGSEQMPVAACLYIADLTSATLPSAVQESLKLVARNFAHPRYLLCSLTRYPHRRRYSLRTTWRWPLVDIQSRCRCWVKQVAARTRRQESGERQGRYLSLVTGKEESRHYLAPEHALLFV